MKPMTGILLAAGQSQRFGSNKLLHPLADGTPMVLHVARNLKAVIPDTIAVVKAGDHETAALLEAENVQVIFNHNAEIGMGSSIACGVRASQQSNSWVIMLADMPYISRQTIRAVAAGVHSRDTICAPLYGDQRGHPVGFGKAYADALIRLTGDQGARQIIAANRNCLELVNTHDRGVIADIDSPDDFPQTAT